MIAQHGEIHKQLNNTPNRNYKNYRSCYFWFKWYKYLHKDCQRELVSANCLQVEQTRVVVARSDGDSLERMSRLTGGGSSDMGSLHPDGQRWWRPGLCSGSWEDRKWSWEAPRWGKMEEIRRVRWPLENSSIHDFKVSRRLLNSWGSTLGPWLRLWWSLLWSWCWLKTACLYFLGSEWHLSGLLLGDLSITAPAPGMNLSFWDFLQLNIGDLVSIVFLLNSCWLFLGILSSDVDLLLLSFRKVIFKTLCDGCPSMSLSNYHHRIQSSELSVSVSSFFLLIITIIIITNNSKSFTHSLLCPVRRRRPIWHLWSADLLSLYFVC